MNPPIGHLPRWCTGLLLAALTALPLAAAPLATRTWTIDGTPRQALLHVPKTAGATSAPVVFVFHGHGGGMQGVARSFRVHELWPEAIVVYPQGLNTPGRLTDPEGKKPGWQSSAGAQGNRDLKLFDQMLATVTQEHRGDPKRVFATGHSNGGGFTYLLWSERGDRLAAVAPSASAALQLSLNRTQPLPPKPVLHLAGRQDALVKFAWQETTMAAIRKSNGCGEGRPWPAHTNATLYAPSPGGQGAPVVTYIHPGGHEFPKAAPELIVAFFREHARP